MIRTQISMTPEQADGLRRLAALRRRSQAAMLRDALDHLLDTDERARRAETAAAALGAYGSGGGNAALDHDAELDEAYRS